MAIVSELRSDDILGGSFCSSDGFVDPHSVLTGFLNQATEQGAQLLRQARVTRIDVDSKGVAGVQTANRTFASRTVVNAAGAWAAEVAALAGIQLPVEPLRRMLVPTEPFHRIRHDVPMTVDVSMGFHFRPEGLGFLMAWNDPAETPGFKLHVDRGFVEKIFNLAEDRVPVFAEAEVNPSRAWAGLYEVTPGLSPNSWPGTECARAIPRQWIKRTWCHAFSCDRKDSRRFNTHGNDGSNRCETVRFGAFCRGPARGGDVGPLGVGRISLESPCDPEVSADEVVYARYHCPKVAPDRFSSLWPNHARDVDIMPSGSARHEGSV